MALAAALAFASVTYVSLEKSGGVKGASGQPAPAQTLTFADIQPILARHCVACHSLHPTNPAFTVPPLGVVMDSYGHVRALSARIGKVAVDSEIMPLGNPTGMTRAERQKLGAWIAAGAPR